MKVETDKISTTKGKPKEVTIIGNSGKPVHRFFCGDCGTPVWTNAESVDGVSFAKVGPLGDFGNRVKMTMEVWCENANPDTLRYANTLHSRAYLMNTKD